MTVFVWCRTIRLYSTGSTSAIYLYNFYCSVDVCHWIALTVVSVCVVFILDSRDDKRLSWFDSKDTTADSRSDWNCNLATATISRTCSIVCDLCGMIWAKFFLNPFSVMLTKKSSETLLTVKWHTSSCVEMILSLPAWGL